MDHEPGYSLEEMGLPPEYDTAKPDECRRMRLDVLQSWYDPARPEVLCADVDKAVQAARLWVFFYCKPARCNAKKYYLQDPEFKYEMVRAALMPHKVRSEPSKAVIQATRHGTKTVTLVHELVSMVLVCRPGTRIVLTEYNDTRTAEELSAVSRQISKNEFIHADFGGAGHLFPKTVYTGHKWNEHIIELLNGSTLMGVPAMAAHRGRHPDWIIIDDPEKDKKKSRNAQWRKEYFDWLFRVMVEQLNRGGHITWIGTNVDEFSCLGLAMRGATKGTNAQALENSGVVEKDSRFDDWHKFHFDLLVEDENGELRSTFPAFLTAEEFEVKAEAIGRDAAFAEFRGDPIMSGERVFARSDYRHGFMKCVENEGRASESYYFLDLKTGDRMPWLDFTESLAVVMASDLADSTDPQSDPSASVVIGVDPNDTVFVLDAWAKRCLVDEHIPIAFSMAKSWKVAVMGWDSDAMQKVIVRWIQDMADEWRKADRNIPIQRPLKNNRRITGGVGKPMRIIGGLSPLLINENIRFMRLAETEAINGQVHKPAQCPGQSHLEVLKTSIDTFTDSGPSGFIDLADALEMAVRLSMGFRGQKKQVQHETDEIISKWRDLGMEFGHREFDPQTWSPAMWKEHNEAVNHQMVASTTEEFDPYE